MSKAAEIEKLRGERERLALAICGGEDAPGYANAQTIETLEKVARDNHNTTMEQIDRIKSQASEIERLRGEVAMAVESLGRSKYWTATMSQAAIKAINESMLEKRRADDAEAKLAKAVEALRFYAWENEMRLPNEGPWGTGSTDFGKVARATLAELTGGKDE